MKKIVLNMNFLDALKNNRSNLWPKKILQLLDIKNDNNSKNKQNSYLIRVGSKDDMNYETNQRYDELLEKYNNVRKHSRSLYTKIRKGNI